MPITQDKLLSILSAANDALAGLNLASAKVSESIPRIIALAKAGDGKGLHQELTYLQSAITVENLLSHPVTTLSTAASETAYYRRHKKENERKLRNARARRAAATAGDSYDDDLPFGQVKNFPSTELPIGLGAEIEKVDRKGWLTFTPEEEEKMAEQARRQGIKELLPASTPVPTDDDLANKRD